MRKRDPGADLAATLAALEQMDGPELRRCWEKQVGTSCPRLRPKLLRLALAWECQAKVHGGVPRTMTQRLDQLAGDKSRTVAARPGMRLVREWRGVLHQVDVGEDGAVHWNGRSWKSLSEVARAITGTRWSGPAFFGLKTAVKDKAARATAHPAREGLTTGCHKDTPAASPPSPPFALQDPGAHSIDCRTIDRNAA